MKTIVTASRFVRFNVVSGLGAGVQLGAVWLLSHVGHVRPVAAGALAVTAAVVHNFAWHRWWTWADRTRDASNTARALIQFVTANGAVSLAGNLVAMTLLVSSAGLSPVMASVAALALTGLANFWLGDRLVFRG